jgi:hypothetical protein
MIEKAFDSDIRLEPYQLQNIIDSISLDGTNWKIDDLSVDGYKNYDEDGNSYYVGVLEVDDTDKTQQDLEVLGVILETAISKKYY